MEEGIEICARCGKMVGTILHGSNFQCTRCGNKSTMMVSYDDYEKTVRELAGFGDASEAPASGARKATPKGAKKPPTKRSKK